MRTFQIAIFVLSSTFLISCSESSKDLSPKETVEVALQAYIDKDELKIKQYMGDLEMNLSYVILGFLKQNDDEKSITDYYKPTGFKDERILIDVASVELELKSLFDDSDGILTFYLDNSSGYWKIYKIEGLGTLSANVQKFERKKREEKRERERKLAEIAREKKRKIAEQKLRREIKNTFKVVKSKHTNLFNPFKDLNLTFHTEKYRTQYNIKRERSIIEVDYTPEIANKYASIQVRLFCKDWRGRYESSIYEFRLDSTKTKIRSNITDIDKIEESCSDSIDIVSYETRDNKNYSVLQDMNRLDDLLKKKDFRKMSLSEILKLKL